MSLFFNKLSRGNFATIPSSLPTDIVFFLLKILWLKYDLFRRNGNVCPLLLTCFLTILPPFFLFCMVKRKHLIRSRDYVLYSSHCHLVAPPQPAAEGTGNLTPPGGKVSAFFGWVTFPSLRGKAKLGTNQWVWSRVFLGVYREIGILIFKVVTAMLYVILGFQFRNINTAQRHKNAA